jgi:hypothetical protein
VADVRCRTKLCERRWIIFRIRNRLKTVNLTILTVDLVLLSTDNKFVLRGEAGAEEELSLSNKIMLVTAGVSSYLLE